MAENEILEGKLHATCIKDGVTIGFVGKILANPSGGWVVEFTIGNRDGGKMMRSKKFGTEAEATQERDVMWPRWLEMNAAQNGVVITDSDGKQYHTHMQAPRPSPIPPS